LGIDYIDLYQIHFPPEVDSAPLHECWDEMAKLVEEGKIGAIGVCNFDTALLTTCESIHHVDSLQSQYSLIRPDAMEKVIPWCRVNRSGVLVYRALASGLLTDHFSLESPSRLEERDWRRRDPDFQTPRLERNLAARDRLAEVAARHSCSTAAAAVAWALASPGVTGAIVGARSPQQVNDWVTAAEIVLTPGTLIAVE
jgi:aryl-alcohol dehydrogenase-like predicted oxidoreductase